MVAGPGGPLDPWMKGETISYYYFGYWIFGNLGSLTYTKPEITYNLSLIFIPSLMGSAVFGLTCSLLTSGVKLRSILGVGIVSSLSVVFLSNLYGGLSFIAQNRMADTAFWDKICIQGLNSSSFNIVDSWRPPFLIMFCTLCLGAAYSGASSKVNIRTLSLILLIAIAGATTSFVNMWSIPIVIITLVFIYLLRWMAGYEHNLLHTMFVPIGALSLAALFLFPFLYKFQSYLTGLQPSPVQTSLVQFLIMWGPLLLFVVPYIVSEAFSHQALIQTAQDSQGFLFQLPD